MDPVISVAPDKRMKGADTLNSQALNDLGVVNLIQVSLEEAFSKCWTTDAHMVAYSVEGTTSHPRLTKKVLGPLRKQGLDVKVNLLMIDVDNPDHEPWSSQHLSAFLAGVEAALEKFECLADFRVSHPTRHGARFMYVPQEPLTPSEAEARSRGLVALWRSAGVLADTGVSDWTRLMRLPFVMRDGEATWEEEWPFEMSWQDRYLDTSQVPLISSKEANAYAEIIPVDMPQPTPEEAEALMYDVSEVTGRRIQSAFYRAAKSKLRGRDCFDCIFKGKALADEGGRNDTIQRMVGSATGLLISTEGVTPQHIYALFFTAAEQLQCSEEDFLATLWSACCKYWEGEDAQLRATLEVGEEAEESVAAIHHAMLAGARSWAPEVDSLGGDDRVAFEWLTRHMIAVNPGGSCNVMNTRGHYDRMSVRKDHLQIRIRAIGMDKIMPVTIVSNDKERPLTGQELVDRYGFMVARVEGSSQDRETYVHRVESGSPVLRLQLYTRRKDLVPLYDPLVDDWLKHFFGSENYAKGIEWISHALAFDEGPIAALSYKGYPGAGKKMLVQGLAEAICTGVVADGGAFDRFNEFILLSPFVVINEGWPSTKGGGSDRADAFRHMVSGDPLSVEEKYQPKIIVRSPMRVIMTANNLDVVAAVFNHRDMSPEDRTALETRIFHVNGTSAPVSWLRIKGGKSFTGKRGKRWIAGDSGEDSNYVLARHFLWLHKNRQAPARGSRLLVDGHMPEALVRAMATRSGRAPLIVEVLISMVENPKYSGMVLNPDKGTAFVTSSGILNYWRSGLSARSGSQELTLRSIGLSLRSLCYSANTELQNLRLPDKSYKRARWRDVDIELLLQEAHDHGFPCKRLTKLVESLHNQDKSKVIPIGR